MSLNIKPLKIISAQKFNMADISLEISPETVGNVQALGANGKAAFSPKAHG